MLPAMLAFLVLHNRHVTPHKLVDATSLHIDSMLYRRCLAGKFRHPRNVAWYCQILSAQSISSLLNRIYLVEMLLLKASFTLRGSMTWANHRGFLYLFSNTSNSTQLCS